MLVQCKFCGLSCNTKGSDSSGDTKFEANVIVTGEKVLMALKMDLHCNKYASKVCNTDEWFAGE